MITRSFRALKTAIPGRDLGLLIGGGGVSMAGSAITLLALILHLRALGPAWIAALLAAELVPMVAGAPLTGLLVDRVRNRELLIGALVVQGAAVAAAASLGLASGRRYLLLGCVLVVGSAAAVANPTVAALLPSVSGEARATRAYGWYSAFTQGGFLAGFAIAGVLVDVGGTRSALLIDAASYLIMAVGVGFVTAQRRPEQSDDNSDDAVSASFWIGFTLVWRDGLLRAAVASLTVTIIAAVAVNIADVFFIVGDLHASPALYGVITASWPLAGIAGAWWAGRLGTDHALFAGLAGAGLTLGLGLLLAGSSTSVIAVLVGWVMGGAANAVQRVTINALTRSRIPDAARGRAFAATDSVLQAANLLGLVAGGALVQAVGARNSLLLAGALTALTSATLWLFRPDK